MDGWSLFSVQTPRRTVTPLVLPVSSFLPPEEVVQKQLNQAVAGGDLAHVASEKRNTAADSGGFSKINEA